jgi:YVTN family beta-propeller protein
MMILPLLSWLNDFWRNKLMADNLTFPKGNISWQAGVSLVVMLVLLLSGGAAARDKGKKKKMDPAKGTIILAGLVYAPVNESDGGSTIAEGIGGVVGAKVELVGTGFVTETDRNGMFYFTKGPEGPVTVIISKEGFRTETLSSTISKGGGMPESLRVELMPEGTEYVGRTPTGMGTLYAAFSPRVVEQSNPHSHWDKNLNTVRAAIAAGADPLTLEGNRGAPITDPKGRNNNPTSGAERTIMIYPPKSPSRTGFHNTNAAPYWLCFDRSGDTLYVANSARQVQVLDAANGNQIIHNLPVQQQGFVTDLSLSADGKYVMAAVMASSPGVMMIDTTTKQPAAYLSVDGVGTMTPTAVATSPDGTRTYVVLDGQMGLGGQGMLAVIDSYSGQTLGTAPVGAKPTGLAFSKDGRFAYVVNSGGGNVTVVDTPTLQPLGLIPVGVSPQKIAVTPDGKKILVTNKDSASVSVIDAAANRVIGTVSVGKGATDVKLSPDGTRAYVSNREDGTISVIDMTTMNAIYVTDAMPRSSPIGLAVRP